MRPLLRIRKARESDEFMCQEIVKDYVMSFANDTFLVYILQETTLQLIVVVWAFMFIFFGLPIIVCFWSIPIVIVGIFCSVYLSFYSKATELSTLRLTNCWVAEAFIPLYLRCTLKELDYEIVRINSTNDGNTLTGFRREIVGTISCSMHYQLDSSLWISRFAVGPKYSFDRVGEPLLQAVLQHSLDNGFQTVELSATDCQLEMRELLLKTGFEIKQIYHKRLVGNFVKIMRSQMGINLNKHITS